MPEYGMFFSFTTKGGSMKNVLICALLTLLVFSCGGSSGSDTSGVNNNNGDTTGTVTGIFLHHSTGSNIWGGGVPALVTQYNTAHDTDYQISEQNFPKDSPYGWSNYPYDYWNIWVNNAGEVAYMEEPTLEILSEQYDLIIWKHCFPVSGIGPDTGNPDISSSSKTIENYMLQYNALKAKMLEFPSVKFIVWTGAALVESQTTEEQAARSRTFFEWVKNEWDEPGDNIFIWDFYELETEGGNVLLSEYASSSGDSHPNSTFSQTVAPYFVQRIVDVIEGRGDSGSITGQ